MKLTAHNHGTLVVLTNDRSDIEAIEATNDGFVVVARTAAEANEILDRQRSRP